MPIIRREGSSATPPHRPAGNADSATSPANFGRTCSFRSNLADVQSADLRSAN